MINSCSAKTTSTIRSSRSGAVVDTIALISTLATSACVALAAWATAPEIDAFLQMPIYPITALMVRDDGVHEAACEATTYEVTRAE